MKYLHDRMNARRARADDEAALWAAGIVAAAAAIVWIFI